MVNDESFSVDQTRLSLGQSVKYDNPVLVTAHEHMIFFKRQTVDTSDLMQTVWPRAGAVGERLWSAAAVNDSDAALPRYVKFRWRQGLMVDWEVVSHG